MEKYANEDRYKHASEHNNEANCVDDGGKWVNFHNYLEIKEDLNEEECEALDDTEWAIPYRSDEIDQLTGSIYIQINVNRRNIHVFLKSPT
jgi:hypothetical protein